MLPIPKLLNNLQDSKSKFLGLLVLFVVYYFLSQASFAISTANEHLATLGLASGFGIWAVLEFGWLGCMGVMLASSTAHLWNSHNLIISAGLGLGAMVQAYVGGRVFRFFQSKITFYGPLMDPLGLILAAFFSALMGSGLGVSILAVQSSMESNQLYHLWTIWMCGDFVGGIYVLHLVFQVSKLLKDVLNRETRDSMLVSYKQKGFFQKGVRTLSILLLTGLIASTLISYKTGTLFLYLSLPIAILLIRFESTLMMSLNLLIWGGVALTATLSFSGPFHTGTVFENLLNLQTYLAGLAISFLFLNQYRKLTFRQGPFFILVLGSSLGSLLAFEFNQKHRQIESDHFDEIVHNNTESIEERFADYAVFLSYSKQVLLNLKKPKDQVAEFEVQDFKPLADAVLSQTFFKGFAGVGLIKVSANSSVYSLLDFQAASGMDKNTLLRNSDLLENPEVGDLLRDFREGLKPRIAAFFNFDDAKSTHENILGTFLFLHAGEAKGTSYWLVAPIFYKKVLDEINLQAKDEVSLDIKSLSIQKNLLVRQPGSEIEAEQKIMNRRDEMLQIKESKLDLFNKQHVLSWIRLPGFRSNQDFTAALMSTTVLLICVLLAGFVANLQWTEKRALDMALEMSASLEKHRIAAFHASKMGTLGAMAAGIAHEVFNPLTIVKGNLSRLISDIKGENTTQEQLILRINKMDLTIDRIVKIIKGLKSFARTGETLPKQSVSPKTMIGNVLDLTREKFNKAEVELRLGVFAEVEVVAASVQIEQVIMNLLHNAFQAIQDLKEKWISIDVVVTVDNKVEITITDSGAGIPAAIADRLMEPFFTTKEGNQGTGLGLSISKGILEDHGGSLRLDREAKNTRFVIVLPKSDLSAY